LPRADDERALLHRGGAPGDWGNLGLWPPAGGRASDAGRAGPAGHDIDYATAAAALARAVGRAAGLGPGQRVLSLACGAGAELVLWVGEFGVAQALGIDRDARPGPAARTPRTELRRGDACRPEVAAGAFDAVLCVDAAYHLSPRADWLAAARRTLRPGGRLAFTDLVLDAPGRGIGRLRALVAPLARPLLRRGADAAGIALDDLVDPARACARVAGAGFTDVRLDRLDEAVLAGFARFVARQTRRLGDDAGSPGWRRARATAALIGPCRAAGLGYALLSATAA
jgi:SAM-dependent methyltransferase